MKNYPSPELAYIRRRAYERLVLLSRVRKLVAEDTGPGGTGRCYIPLNLLKEIDECLRS